MGGDHAPEIVVRGIAIAAERHPGMRFLLVGESSKLAPLLAKHKRAAAIATVREAADVIGNDTKPASRRADAPHVHAGGHRCGGRGEAPGVVSAGNTGALMALAKIVLKSLPGIDRPAMAAIDADGARRRGDAGRGRQCVRAIQQSGASSQ